MPPCRSLAFLAALYTRAGIDVPTKRATIDVSLVRDPSGVCKIAANKRISALSLFLSFQEIHSGCRTVAAQGLGKQLVTWFLVKNFPANQRVLDGADRHYLDISGKEFLERWESGYYEDPDQPGIMSVVMLLPFAQSE